MTPNSNQQPIHLFVYGSLRESSIFESVCGLSFTLHPRPGQDARILTAELAMLDGYRRASPDNVYYYAIKDPHSRIQGYVIYNIPPQAMAVIDRYEGKMYDRETVSVHTANGTVAAQAYLGSQKKMKKRFGDRFHVNLIHELWLRKRIENFFDKHTRPGETSADAEIERRAMRELLGTTERDLVVSHLGRNAVSDYTLEHELSRPCLSIKSTLLSPEAQPYVVNYLGLVIKQVLLNQFELEIQERFRFELNQISPTLRYYTRTISLLAALRIINLNHTTVDMLIRQCLESHPPDGSCDLLDYVKFAIRAADNLFDPRVMHTELNRIRSNIQPGLVPMGAELEFSNLGLKAVQKDAWEKDPAFDGFLWFERFGLDILTWKLGGYIDDHSGDYNPGRRGFFELAPGRLNIAGQLSRPVTGDPWVLGQLIREITAFYPVKPHSLHLSFQLRQNQIGKQSILPLSIVKCLFVMGGGIQMTQSGRLWVSRMGPNEIRSDRYGEELVFARTSKRRNQPEDELLLQDRDFIKPVVINQYKFIRLDSRASYEPLIIALKGIQLSLNPGDYLTLKQLSQHPNLQTDYEELKTWANNPQPISQRTLRRFLDTVYAGLMNERHYKAFHKPHYIDWAIGAIEMQILLFNKQLEASDAQRSTEPE